MSPLKFFKGILPAAVFAFTFHVLRRFSAGFQGVLR